METTIKRQKAMQEARRQLILDAARRVFIRKGVERSSVREIAKEAGYTPGALYAYFDSKHALLSALLADMVLRIKAEVVEVRPPKGQMDRLLVLRGQAWLAYLVANPRDMELVVFLMGAGLAGGGAVALAQEVHQGMRESLGPFKDALVHLGLTSLEAERELESALACGLGLLLTQDRGRLQSLELSPEFLYQRYLEHILSRYSSPEAPSSVRAPNDAKPQVDLF